MIVFAIAMTIAALGWSAVVVFGNGMRSSPGDFQGGGSIAVAWVLAVTFWLAWWVG